MESLQRSYVGAVMAAAGCVLGGKPEIDEGVDLIVSHRSDKHATPEKIALLEVQLKATATFAGKNVIQVSANLSGDSYNYFATPDPSVDKIVVILSMPKDQSRWTYSRPKALSIHHCAYWVNLAGRPKTTNASVTVHAPTSQVFNDVALCDMMERIGQGGRP